ncbi:MAG: MarR family transcriptional regulator [Alphaproteobacteria bacterium]|nr:MarR family transcriptional regulator [Alphaproteobacteria bacterium]
MRRSGAQGSLFSQAIAARVGISASDFECLDLVILEGAVTPGRLAEASGLTTGAITGVIDRLERAGFVRRDPDPTDRRRVLVRAVPDGVRVIGPYYKSLVTQLGVILDDLDTGELARLLALYTRVNNVFAGEIVALKNTSDKHNDAAA